METTGLKAKKQQFVLDAIYAVSYDETTGTETEVTDTLSDTEKLQYLADCLEQECFYPNNLRRFKGNYSELIADHLQGLPSWLNVPYLYVDILKIGKDWGYSLGTEKKEDAFCANWWNLLATNIIQLFDAKGINYDHTN